MRPAGVTKSFIDCSSQRCEELKLDIEVCTCLGSFVFRYIRSQSSGFTWSFYFVGLNIGLTIVCWSHCFVHHVRRKSLVSLLFVEVCCRYPVVLFYSSALILPYIYVYIYKYLYMNTSESSDSLHRLFLTLNLRRVHVFLTSNLR